MVSSFLYFKHIVLSKPAPLDGAHGGVWMYPCRRGKSLLACMCLHAFAYVGLATTLVVLRYRMWWIQFMSDVLRPEDQYLESVRSFW